MLSPYGTVVTSAATYSAILGISIQRDHSYQSLRTRIKTISASHSLFTVCLTLLALSQRWSLAPQSQYVPSDEKGGDDLPPRVLDDSQNPLISSQNSLANFITAWEAGYLLYDTLALFIESYIKDKSRSFVSAFLRLIRESPVFVVHHALLAAALLWLQTYVATKREKGLKVIMAFFLMNASNPLLHLRWYRKKTTGRSNMRIDAALATIFAITRFGSVYWAIWAYGQYHGLGTWQSLRRQRLVCQSGTGLLTGLNLVWWVALILQTTRQKQRTKSH